MERTESRKKFIKGFRKFLDLVDIDEKNSTFLSLLRKNEHFKDHLDNIEGFQSDESKKIYIFLELTKDRGLCETIIEILFQSNQTKAAEELKEYNKSVGQIDILNASKEIKIPVLKRELPKDGWNPTNSYYMFQKPRGKFIIINNVQNFLENESKRFEHIFAELLFIPILLFNLNVKQMETELINISKDKKLKEDEAIGLMIITHGGDEKVLGFDACRELEKPLHLRNSKIIDKDQIEFCNLVKIFTECNFLKRKPKVFIFDCCREKMEKPMVDIMSLHKRIKKSIELLVEIKLNPELSVKNEEFEKYRGNWVNENTDTFIIHSCSEGHKSWIWGGISAFGQAFSHAIARYAVDEGLQSIMGRTCTLMKKFKEEMADEDFLYQTKYSAPETKDQNITRILYFNPGVERKN